MKLKVQTTINASRESVWKLITDIENSQQFIRGINRIEVLNRPANGLVGFKWKETRTLFGKTAEETMWVTDSAENEFYDVRAESHGSVYETRMSLEEFGDATVLAMDFEATPQTYGARVMWALTGFMFKGATRKGLTEDLKDIRAEAEKG